MTQAEQGGSAASDAGAADAPGSVVDGEAPDAGTTEAPVQRRRRRWPRVLGVLMLVLGLLAGAAAGGFWYLAKHLEGNVTTIAGLDLPKPATSYEPVNFLIMGSDSRSDGNTVGGETSEISGARSDTTLLVHVAGDRKSALVVSIPRDTLVKLPKCASDSGQWEVTAKFNASFAFGGPSCTVAAVEQITGVKVNHAVVVDFLGFKHVVEAIGGVDVCLESPVYDRDSGLDLPAGWSRVTGDQALAFVRARKSLGDGSDIDRIARQHQFLASAIRQATDRSLLLKPVTLYKMLDAATASLSVDEGIDQIGEMASMAQSMRDLRPENITFVTMPFTYSSDGSNVLINEPVANEIWTAIRNDEQWPKPVPAGADALTVAPADIAVLVSNGNGRDNAATDAAADLAAVGFGIAGLSMADASTYPESVVVYNPADAEAARTLAQSVTGSVLREDPAAASGRLQLIVGANYSGAQSVAVARQPEGTAADPLPVTADQSICAS